MADQTPAAPAAADTTRAAADAVRAFHETADRIRERCAPFAATFAARNQDARAFADGLIARIAKREMTAEDAMTAIMDKLAELQQTIAEVVPQVSVGASSEDPAAVVDAAAEAVAARATQHLPANQRVAVTDRAREFMGHSLLGTMAMVAMRARGAKIPQHVLMNPTQLERHLSQRAFHATGDFPLLLANALNKALQPAYQAATPTYRQFFARKTFTDFKPHSFLRGGDFPDLLETGESGEIQYGTISETQNQASLATYGRQIKLTRRVLVNDDLGFFTDIAGKIGQRVAAFENKLAFIKLQENTLAGPNVTDVVAGAAVTQAMFHADRGNLAGSGGAIAVDTLGAGRAAVRKQTTLDGIKLNLAPSILLVGPDDETLALQYTSSAFQPSDSGKINPWTGRLTPLVDAEITSTSWYLFADPAQAETLCYGFLDGQEAPMVREEEPFNFDGFAVRVIHDFAVFAIDYRGAYRNPGT